MQIASSQKSETLLPVVAIGASAGGLEALVSLLSEMPTNVDCAFIVVTHLDPTHKSLLPEILARSTNLKVSSIESSVEVKPNNVYVIPPNRDLTIVENRLEAHEQEQPRGFRTPINRFFESLAKSQNRKSIAVILSGSGSDGASGVRLVKQAGGVVLVQSPSEARYDGMPQSAIATGCTDEVLSVREMPSSIAAHVQAARSARVEAPSASHTNSYLEVETQLVDQIIHEVATRTGQDFQNYKYPTLYRRIGRRVLANHCSDLKMYLHYLRNHPEESGILRDEFLINVTRFFRDPAAFEEIRDQVIPRIFESSHSQASVRIWIPGCSTGEEAYTIGMLFLDAMAKLRQPTPITLFATDIDNDALATARAATYSRQEVEQHVPSDYIDRYFFRSGQEYKIQKQLREKIIFSNHDLVGNPPLSQLDFIVCRNVFIYFNNDLQHRILNSFHYSLRSSGFLFLGSSESLGSAQALFTTKNEKLKIYQKNPSITSPSPLLFTKGIAGLTKQEFKPTVKITPPTPALSDLVSRYFAQELIPPFLIINDKFQVVFWNDRVKTYLNLAGGVPSFALFDLLDPKIHLEVRGALLSAVKHRKKGRYQSVLLKGNGVTNAKLFSIEAHPLMDGSEDTHLTLVTFHEESLPKSEKSAPPKRENHGIEQVLSEELTETRKTLEIVLSEAENSHQELVSANEELMSTNEELQSTAQELETSREELQSLNEELEAVNSELRRKVQELTETNNDMSNLFVATEIGVLFLDRVYRIKNFTPAVTKLFNLIRGDLHRPISHVSHRILDLNIEQILRELQERDGAVLEREIRTQNGQSYMFRAIPYRTEQQEIDGWVLTFVDVTNLRRAESALAAREGQFVSLFKVIPDTVMIVSQTGYVLDFRPGNLGSFLGEGPFVGLSLNELEASTRTIFSSSREQLWKAIREALTRGDSQEAEIELEIEQENRWLELRIAAGSEQYAVCVIRDVTQRKEAERLRLEKLSGEKVSRARSDLLANVSHELRTPLNAIIGFADILLQEIDGKLLDQHLPHVESIASAGRHLLDLVNEILEFSKLEATSMQLDAPAEFLLDALIDDVVGTCAPLLKAGDLSLKVVPPTNYACLLNADRKRCRQVLLNLTSNAIKFTPKGGQIEISYQVRSEGLEITVADSGVGVPENGLEKIFERFEQARQPVKNTVTGTGLGLNLVKSIVKLHQGSVWATLPGLKGRGTTFHVLFPSERARINPSAALEVS